MRVGSMYIFVHSFWSWDILVPYKRYEDIGKNLHHLCIGLVSISWWPQLVRQLSLQCTNPSLLHLIVMKVISSFKFKPREVRFKDNPKESGHKGECENIDLPIADQRIWESISPSRHLLFQWWWGLISKVVCQEMCVHSTVFWRHSWPLRWTPWFLSSVWRFKRIYRLFIPGQNCVHREHKTMATQAYEM